MVTQKLRSISIKRPCVSIGLQSGQWQPVSSKLVNGLAAGARPRSMKFFPPTLLLILAQALQAADSVSSEHSHLHVNFKGARKAQGSSWFAKRPRGRSDESGGNGSRFISMSDMGDWTVETRSVSDSPQLPLSPPILPTTRIATRGQDGKDEPLDVCVVAASGRASVSDAPAQACERLASSPLLGSPMPTAPDSATAEPKWEPRPKASEDQKEATGPAKSRGPLQDEGRVSVVQ